jgi:hypothetical protein
MSCAGASYPLQIRRSSAYSRHGHRYHFGRLSYSQRGGNAIEAEPSRFSLLPALLVLTARKGGLLPGRAAH